MLSISAALSSFRMSWTAAVELSISFIRIWQNFFFAVKVQVNRAFA